MIFIGVDPSERHTGIVSTDEAGKLIRSHEIKTEGLPLLLALDLIKIEARAHVGQWVGPAIPWTSVVFAVEKQLLSGYSSAALIASQMALFEGIRWAMEAQASLIWPLPVQLKSYSQRIWGIPTNAKKGQIVDRVRDHLKTINRMSQHVAEAYLLASMARDVLQGRWKYAASSKEPNLIPKGWNVVYG